jgi:hypothetical protein
MPALGDPPLTAASMVGCMNAIVGGVAVALALRWLLEAAVPVAAVTGALVALGLAALCFGYQVRRFRRAAPLLDPGQPSSSTSEIRRFVGGATGGLAHGLCVAVGSPAEPASWDAQTMTAWV